MFRRRRGFAKGLCREGGDLAFKASLLSLTFPKSPTLPLKHTFTRKTSVHLGNGLQKKLYLNCKKKEVLLQL